MDALLTPEIACQFIQILKILPHAEKTSAPDECFPFNAGNSEYVEVPRQNEWASLHEKGLLFNCV